MPQPTPFHLKVSPELEPEDSGPACRTSSPIPVHRLAIALETLRWLRFAQCGSVQQEPHQNSLSCLLSLMRIKRPRIKTQPASARELIGDRPLSRRMKDHCIEPGREMVGQQRLGKVLQQERQTCLDRAVLMTRSIDAARVAPQNEPLCYGMSRDRLDADFRVRGPAQGRCATFPGKPRNHDERLDAHASLPNSYWLGSLPTVSGGPDQSVANAAAIRPTSPTTMMSLVAASMPHAARE